MYIDNQTIKPGLPLPNEASILINIQVWPHCPLHLTPVIPTRLTTIVECFYVV
jgi:hypothetical protein